VTTVPCKGCGRLIRWATLREGNTITSKRIPLDARFVPIYAVVPGPKLNDNVDVVCDRVGQAGSAIELYVSHAYTCPKANDFSGKGKA
jgi:hypothetical protein